MNQELPIANTMCTQPSLNPLKMKINSNCIQSLRSCCTVNTHHVNYKNRQKNSVDPVQVNNSWLFISCKIPKIHCVGRMYIFF